MPCVLVVSVDIEHEPLVPRRLLGVQLLELFASAHDLVPNLLGLIVDRLLVSLLMLGQHLAFLHLVNAPRLVPAVEGLGQLVQLLQEFWDGRFQSLAHLLPEFLAKARQHDKALAGGMLRVVGHVLTLLLHNS